MSIEQTSQLILLILNSVLMTLLSAFLLGGAWLRQNTLLGQLRQARSHYYYLTRQEKVAPVSATVSTTILAVSSSAVPSAVELAQPRKMISAHQLKQVREQRQRLSCQYQWSRVGLLTLHAAVLIFSASLFVLALRSLLAFDGLIPAALLLFTIGTAGLLTGTGCVLVDFAQGNSNSDSLGRSLAQIIQQISRQILRPWRSRRPRLDNVSTSQKSAELSAPLN
ncbi:MAG: hypothetical protein WA783_16255 [Phormidesmis sp.]